MSAHPCQSAPRRCALLDSGLDPSIRWSVRPCGSPFHAAVSTRPACAAGARCGAWFRYSFAKSGHDRTPTVLADRQLQDYAVPSFEAAVDAGVATVMEVRGAVGNIAHSKRSAALDS